MRRQPTRRNVGATRRIGSSFGIMLSIVMLLVACGGPSTGNRPTITVTSGDSPEQVLMGQITILALREDGYNVIDRTRLGDPWIVRTALQSGAADICWEYTGDVWMVHLAHDRPIADAEEVFARVREEDAYNGISWLAVAPCQRTMSIVMRRDLAAELEITTLEDLAFHIRRQDNTLRLCAPQQLYAPYNGIQGLQRLYDFRFREDLIQYTSVADGYKALSRKECDCAVGFSTDAEITELKLSLLQDTKGFFQASNLAVSVRAPVSQEFPGLEQRLLEISQKLTQKNVSEMCYQTQVKGTKPETVAKRFLTDQALIGPKRRAKTPTPTQ